jgi:imidazolonepropionase
MSRASASGLPQVRPKADLVLEDCTQLLTCKPGSKDLVGLVGHGWVAAAGGRILAAGSRRDVLDAVDTGAAQVFSGKDKVVVPGFVDAHTHLVFGGSRVKEYAARMVHDDPETLRRLGIKTGIMATVAMTRNSTEEELYRAAAGRLRHMLQSGSTTVESKSGYGLSLHSELKILELNRRLDQDLPVDVVSTFLGAHGWPDDIPKDKYIDMLLQEMLPLVAQERLARFCDVWCDEGHYTAAESGRILRAARDHGLEPKIHTDAYSYIGGSDLAAEMGMASADHLNYTPPEAIRKLARKGVPGVLLPAIDFAVKHPRPFQARPMLEEGLDLALATNCCPGCYVESMPLVLALACREHRMSAEEAIRAATLGGARALGLEHDRGSLEPGKLADLQVWDAHQYEEIIYRIGGNLVERVFKNGRCVVDTTGQGGREP